MTRFLHAALLALTLAAGAAPAAEWVYPETARVDAAGNRVFPTSDGRTFATVREREAYLRESRQIRARVRRAEDAAARAEARVPRPPAVRAVPPLTPALDRPLPIRRPGKSEADARRRAERQGLLQRSGRAAEERRARLQGTRAVGSAAAAADLAWQRAMRAATIARGEDRLYSGAATARSSLEDRALGRPGSLIAVPRIGD